MSLLEVVAAVVLLTLVGGTVLTTLSAAMSSQVRQQRRLAAAELANRLMIQYLDDENSMPDANLPVQYGQEFYRWELRTRPASIRVARIEAESTRAQRGGLSLDRFKAVTVSVWLSERSGGTREREGGAPGWSLTRLVDPTYVFRNPDSLDNLLKTPGGIERLLQQFQGATPGGTVERGTTPAPRSPAGSGTGGTGSGRGSGAGTGAGTRGGGG